MKTIVENINSVQQKINITLPAEEVNKAFNKSFLNIQKKANIQGFRPGKAPLSLIKRQYQHQVGYEISESLIKNNLFNAIKEQNLKPISSPNIEHVDTPQENKQFAFTAIIDIYPEIQVEEKYKNLDISYSTTEFENDLLEKELKNIARRQAKSATIDDPNAVASENMLANVSYAAFDQEEKIEALCVDKRSLALGHDEVIPEIEAQIFGIKVNETKSVDVHIPKSYPDTKLSDKTFNFKITVHELKTLEIPSLDDELAKDLNFDNFDALKKVVKDNIVAQIEQKNKEAKDSATFDALHKNITFDVPPVMVDQVIDNIIATFCRTEAERKEALANKEIRTTIKPEAQRRAKNTLMLYEIAKSEKIEISDENIKTFLKDKQPQSQKLDQEELEKIFNQNKEKIREDLLFEKTLEKILTFATVKNTPKKSVS